MSNAIVMLGDVRVFVVSGDGALLQSERAATDLIGDSYSAGGAEMIALPVARLGEAFFTLKTRIAGLMLQKFMNYGFRVAIVGDIAAYVAASDALRDFVRESNRGRHVWFVRDLDELGARLAG
ncbi:MAG TPA: DUF4180 domain-containing protein [Rhizomicrobium sp.]|jgi:hypothetical protein|nr:DUF4180 domain-containing protein [Rhizomicrobium sp.]